VEDETGFLVDARLDPAPPRDPSDPYGFARRLADAINRFANDPALGERMGAAGRQRVLDKYSWGSIAEQTLDLYRRLTGKP